MLLSLLLSWRSLGAQREAEKRLRFIPTKSHVNPPRCARGGEPGQPGCARGGGLGGSAALISEHVAWLSCGGAGSRRRVIAL